VFAPLLVAVFWIGFFPNPILSRIGPSIDRSLALIEARALASREYDARQAMAGAGIKPCCPEHEKMLEDLMPTPTPRAAAPAGGGQ